MYILKIKAVGWRRWRRYKGINYALRLNAKVVFIRQQWIRQLLIGCRHVYSDSGSKWSCLWGHITWKKLPFRVVVNLSPSAAIDWAFPILGESFPRTVSSSHLSFSLPPPLSFFLALSFSLRIDQRETTGKTSTGNSKSIPDAFKSFRGSLSQHSPRNGLTELHFSRVGIASGGWRQALTLTQTMDPSIALHFDYWFHLVSFVCVCVCVVFVFFWSILSI